MVQVINRGASLGGNLGQALGNLGGGLIAGQFENKRQEKEIARQKQQQQEKSQSLNTALDRAQKLFNEPGKSDQEKQIGLYQILNEHPEVADKLSSHLGTIQKNQKNATNPIEDQKTFDTVSQSFGKPFAELYMRASEGGKTKLIQAGLDAKQRGMDLDQLLGPFENALKQNNDIQEDLQQSQQSLDEEALPVRSILPKTDFDKGLNPSERTRRQENRYNKNLPIYQELSTRTKGLESEKQALDTLDELNQSGKLPNTFGRLNVNLKSGELLVPALASPEAQRFVKTINDFTTRAKDSYGSRVTNFDLQQFMKRLPTLANTEEGRAQIIEQMKLINELNTLQDRTTQDVIDRFGGVRNIDYDKAEHLAEKETKGQKNDIRRRFQLIGKEADSSFSKRVKELNAKVPEGHILVEKDGSLGYIPKSKLSSALKKGYKKI